MDLLDATERLERIELLAKIAEVSEISVREKTIALTWIGEIAKEIHTFVRFEMRPTLKEGQSSCFL